MPSLLHKLSHLKIDRSRGAAPHKPLLLLCLLELAEEGALTDELLPITGELAFRFSSFWSVVAHRRSQKPDLKLPLFHMRSDGFWQPLDEQRQILLYRDLPACIRFDAEFLGAINDPAFRAQARLVLIRSYFEPNEQEALWALLGKAPPPADAGGSAETPADPEAVERGREGRFRIGVVTAYDYTCALTGYRLVTLASGTIVDAAHIHQFARSRNNALNNGIALSKNAHWLFDHGLWSIRDDHTVLVAKRHFAEVGDAAHLLSRMQDCQLTLPANPAHWPAAQYLAWHRSHKFLGG